MKNILSFFLLISVCATSNATCTDPVKIQDLAVRTDGWIHVKAVGLADMDIMNCGKNDHTGMLLNFNDSYGTIEGKQLMFSTLLSIYMSGKSVQLCSGGCDSQHTVYSRLDSINNIQ